MHDPLNLLPCVEDFSAMDCLQCQRLEYHILQWPVNVDGLLRGRGRGERGFKVYRLGEVLMEGGRGEEGRMEGEEEGGMEGGEEGRMKERGERKEG